jgi:hypothetical protein
MIISDCGFRIAEGRQIADLKFEISDIRGRREGGGELQI